MTVRKMVKMTVDKYDYLKKTIVKKYDNKEVIKNNKERI
jgi:hypothetical protein